MGCRQFASIAFAACSIACGAAATAPAPPTSSSVTISAVASAHLNEIVNNFQQRWYFRSQVEWNTFRQTVLFEARDAQTIEDTLPAIKLALTMLGDRHSYYVTRTGQYIFNPASPSAFGACASNPEPPEPPRFADIGYVRVRVFLDGDRTVRARAIQDAIRAEDRPGLAGWIVDLRNSHGGDLWPVAAGLGSILGDGIAGYFMLPGSVVKNRWGYEAGRAFEGDTTIMQLENPVALRIPNPRVAVLTDTGVSSSGEAMTIAFRERPNTRSFGLPTCGLSTGVTQVALLTGGVIGIVDTRMADRTQRQYGEAVFPDEIFTDANALVLRAAAWLRGQ